MQSWCCIGSFSKVTCVTLLCLHDCHHVHPFHHPRSFRRAPYLQPTQPAVEEKVNDEMREDDETDQHDDRDAASGEDESIEHSNVPCIAADVWGQQPTLKNAWMSAVPLDAIKTFAVQMDRILKSWDNRADLALGDITFVFT